MTDDYYYLTLLLTLVLSGKFKKNFSFPLSGKIGNTKKDEKLT